MPDSLSRREFVGCVASATALGIGSRLPGVIIDTHIHLFAADQERFPYHRDAPYRPPAADLKEYETFVRKSKIDHVVIVHPEPYQDDHRYLEYCFDHEPCRGFFKGTCLFDPIAAETPSRMETLVQKHPKRIVALRIHEMGDRGASPATSGTIRNRDLRHPRMKDTWRTARDLGLTIQMHFKPYFAQQIGELASQFEDVAVILDHLGRAGMGTQDEFEEVIGLAKLPRTYIKFSGLGYSSKQGHPYRDAKPIVTRAFDAFGPDRMIWGGLGKTMEEFKQAIEVFETLLDQATEADRAKIRGSTAMNLFGF